jgi:NAD(P)-dependent dehydrogenase (short-subunit alcohol dehydrogenase family)
VAALDLLDPLSIDSFARDFLSALRPVHMLINCAGIMAVPLARNRRGYESQWATNHLGHFHLAVRLWPALQRAAGARIVSVSSRGHRIAPVDFADPNFERRSYDKWVAYGQSKTANALFAVGADMRGEADAIRAFALHPGSIVTALARHLTVQDLQQFGLSGGVPYGFVPRGRSAAEGGVFKTIEQGAATIVWCAASRQLDGMGGVYCEDSDISPISDTADPALPGVRPWAVDRRAADELWRLSEHITGLAAGSE